jgi:hypothetical protein
MVSAPVFLPKVSHCRQGSYQHGRRAENQATENSASENMLFNLGCNIHNQTNRKPNRIKFTR